MCRLKILNRWLFILAAAACFNSIPARASTLHLGVSSVGNVGSHDIDVGDTVEWQWLDFSPHNIVGTGTETFRGTSRQWPTTLGAIS